MTKTENRRAARRRIGRDRRTAASPVQQAPSAAAVGRGRLAILVTIAAWAAYCVPTLWRAFTDADGVSIARVLEALTYVVITTVLAFSAVVYLFSRHGEMRRGRRHQRTPRALIDARSGQSRRRGLTTLVPSYREDERVIYQSLLSAALQECPDQRVVLLIDDPPSPDSRHAIELLESARAQPARVAAQLDGPAERFRSAQEAFVPSDDPCSDALECASEYFEAAHVVRGMRHGYEVFDHSDRFMRDDVLGRLEHDLESVGHALVTSADNDQPASSERIEQLYERLVSTFTCELSSFERKQFANLSHEANKAMNLNSYIGLMGHHYRIEGVGSRRALAVCDEADAELSIPASEYLLTLDADSMLLPEYCLRLTHRLEQPGFEDVAVIQTPYSSIPGAATRLERIAGATTDIQYLLHQGMTYYDATFWVGANAILRRSALDDIEEIDESGGWPVKKYIADRTVIEDTESSIDLVARGWRLHNYHERLSYSATPPDFGSLCIQRERWANGGLVILPKFLKMVRGSGANRIGSMMRLNYLASIAWGSIALLFLLLYPFSERLLSPIAVAIAAPYFIVMASDLHRIGFKRTDVVRVYAFNLLMLPVNLVGAIKSMYQAATGRKYAFARTPKVRSRTTSKLGFAAFPYVLIAWSAWTVYRDLDEGNIAHAVFAGVNALLGLYGLVAFIGIRNSLVDVAVRAGGVFMRDVDGARSDDVVDSDDLWSDVLFYGDSGSTERLDRRIPSQLARFEPHNFLPTEERPRSGSSASSASSAPSRTIGSDDVDVERRELQTALAETLRAVDLIEKRMKELDASERPMAEAER
jgi:cellulose synthase/poly-beta-1,6-N-acetylglucosamine synthase-like glycosyltransferase